VLNTFVQRFPVNTRERQAQDIITSPLALPFTVLFKGGAYSSFLVRRLDLFRKFVWMKWRSGNPSKLGAGFRRPVDPRAMESYLAVLDTPAKRAGLAAFPKMIPNRPDHPNASYVDQIRYELQRWHIPVLVAWADGDMAWKPDEGVRNAGHFLQEDAGEEVARCITRFLDARCRQRPSMQVVAE
jgi:pimeloyl-ACP methyl ester carboxylesterase